MLHQRDLIVLLEFPRSQTYSKFKSEFRMRFAGILKSLHIEVFLSSTLSTRRVVDPCWGKCSPDGRRSISLFDRWQAVSTLDVIFLF